MCWVVWGVAPGINQTYDDLEPQQLAQPVMRVLELHGRWAQRRLAAWLPSSVIRLGCGCIARWPASPGGRANPLATAPLPLLPPFTCAACCLFNVQLNIAFPSTGCQKKLEIEDDAKL